MQLGFELVNTYIDYQILLVMIIRVIPIYSNLLVTLSLLMLVHLIPEM